MKSSKKDCKRCNQTELRGQDEEGLGGVDPNRGNLQCDRGDEGLREAVLNPPGQQGSKREEEGLRK